MKKNKLLSRLLVLIGVLIMNVSQVWGTLTKMTNEEVIAVLDEGKVMVYLGVGSGWGTASQSMALHDGNSKDDIVNVTTSRGSSDSEPDDLYF